MRNRLIIQGGVILLLLLLVSGCTGASEQVDEEQTFDEMVAFVQNAFEYAVVHGKDEAVRAFNDPEGEFIQGELYIFAYEEDGRTLALPFQPELIGTSRYDHQDAEGKYFIREIIEAGRSGGDVVRYLYPDPSRDFATEPKLSYVMPGGEGWVLGSGIYSEDEPGIPDQAVREALRRFVMDAAEYAEDVGRDEALRTFNDQTGPFVRGDLYIHALDMNGIALALPHQPELIGTSMIDLQDSHGVNVTKVEIGLVQIGGGFIYYDYPDPSHGMEERRKMAYVTKVDDDWWIGAGIYLTGKSTIGSEAVMMGENARLKEEIRNRLAAFDQDVADTARHIEVVGMDDPSTEEVLAYAAGSQASVIDVVVYDADGIITAVQPPEFASSIGIDISAQSHIQRVLQAGEPTLSPLFLSVEGPDAVSIAYPLRSPDNEIIGGISAIFAPDIFISEVLEGAEVIEPYSVMVIQTDSVILYSPDDAEIGEKLFSEDGVGISADHTEFLNRIGNEARGAAIINSSAIWHHIVWETVSLHGTDWRVMVITER
ncbi:cache domain-containing protein [Methanocalculus chunghsingensis]|uniref:cache domain-containing protein n=1 Tax=Methanocalculus chunghsingensis TaxID=156457 RepID=UPI001B8C2DAA|nr:cache domain-containing protein [Methanocalculus chunghsingensis]